VALGPYDRREILKLGGAAALTVAGVRCAGGGPEDEAQLVEFDPATLMDEAPDSFPLGVQAGAMTPDSVLLWTYVTDRVNEVWLSVWRAADEPGSVYLLESRVVTPTHGYVKVRVNGLGSGQYFYTFSNGSPVQYREFITVDRPGVGRYERSRIGTFRSAFGPDESGPLTIAGLTCTSLRNAPFTALELLTRAPPDLTLHLGDMSYNDNATTLSAYRLKWRETLSQVEYQDALAAAGFYMTWDDHEIDNNFNPESMDPGRLDAGKRAFFEALAVERGENDRLWRSYRWGKTAEFFVVDSRSERRPSTVGTDDPIYISHRQMDWLKRGIVNSPARYKVVLNSVPMAEMGELWNFAATDRWEGYRKQRDELVDHLVANEVEDVLFLSGDFHCGFVTRLDRKGPARRYWEVAVGPTGNGPNPIPALVESGDLPREEVFPEDQFIYYSSSDRAMTWVTLDPDADGPRVRFVDAREDNHGAVLFDETLTSAE
jgi:alkaline phosphatase D